MRRVMVVAGVVLFATNAFAQEGGMGRGGGAPAGPVPTCPASGYGAQAYLAMFGRGVTYVGEGELARVWKIAHNTMFGVIIHSLCEITLLAEKAGIPQIGRAHV